MLKRMFFAAALTVALTGCRKAAIAAPARVRPVTTSVASPIRDDRRANVNTAIDPSAPSMFVGTTAIGSRRALDGTVAAKSIDFKAGEPVFLTMRFTKSPGGLRSSVSVFDVAHKRVQTESRDMNGANVITFQLPALKPGKYKVTGYWGGNVACEYPIRVGRR